MSRRRTNAYRLLPGGLAEIELTRGFWTLVDADQVHRLLAYTWYASVRRTTVYAVTSKGRLYMHRLLLPHDAPQTDHKNGDGLDNRLVNLRPATVAQNCRASRKLKSKTSQFKGVSYNRACTRRPWEGTIMKDRVFYRERFATELEAAHWYDAQAHALFGEFAVPNFPTATVQ